MSRCFACLSEEGMVQRMFSLPGCPHEICGDCMGSHFSMGKIQCLTCGQVSFAEVLEDFRETGAKGLSVRKSLESEYESREDEGSGRGSNSSSHAHILPPGSSECQKHGRPFEAFCFSDSKFLCVRCILDKTHFNHQLEGLPEACDRAGQLVRARDSYLRSFGSTVHPQVLQKVEESNFENESLAKKATAQVEQFFKEIFDVLVQKKNTLLQKIQSQASALMISANRIVESVEKTKAQSQMLLSMTSRMKAFKPELPKELFIQNFMSFNSSYKDFQSMCLESEQLLKGFRSFSELFTLDLEAERRDIVARLGQPRRACEIFQRQPIRTARGRSQSGVGNNGITTPFKQFLARPKSIKNLRVSEDTDLHFEISMLKSQRLSTEQDIRSKLERLSNNTLKRSSLSYLPGFPKV